MEYLERYLTDLQQSFSEINYVKFGINLLVTAVLTSLLALFYIRFGNAISNRRRFSRNLLPLAITTMLIIFVVKSSVALSLGLVGALSIVRFRSAIKEPEELTYLFLAIGLGLAAGADEILIAVVAFILIVGILFLRTFLQKGNFIKHGDNMHLNLSTSHKDLQAITTTLTGIFKLVELKRVDDNGQQLDIAFVIEAGTVAQIEQARQKLTALAPDITLSFVEQRHIAV